MEDALSWGGRLNQYVIDIKYSPGYRTWSDYPVDMSQRDVSQSMTVESLDPFSAILCLLWIYG